IPAANEVDLYEVDDEVKKAITFMPMQQVAQVIEIALMPEPLKKAKKETNTKDDSMAGLTPPVMKKLPTTATVCQ
ncbi:MAG: hypothetical protein R3Y06_12305, partial [Faecalibacterium sp.]